MRTVNFLTKPERLSLIDARLNELTGGSAAALARLRDSAGVASISVRCELAYLVKLKTELAGRAYVPAVEVRIAGVSTDSTRRVFARLASDRNNDGLTIDLETGEAVKYFDPIPSVKE